MTILAGQNIGVVLKGRQVLNGVTVAAARGEVLGLLGPNGAGKTTLLKALAGLLPCSGQVAFEGQAVAALPPSERARRIAYLPQGTQAHWAMPVEQVVALGRLPHRERFAALGDADRAAINRAMEEADVGSLTGRPLNALSGGERARVLLARALAVEAPVLLADEPIAHLDPGHQLAVLDLLRRRAEKGDAVIVVLHDLALAARSCHRVCVLDHGSLEADGPPAAILDDGLLDRVYGVRTIRGMAQNQSYLLPWEKMR